MANTPTGAALRKQKLEEAIAEVRATTVKDLLAVEAEYDMEKQPWFDTFRILENVNQPDEHTKAEFLQIVAADKRAMKAISEGIMGALDAMERDMRRTLDQLEARIQAEGEPADGRVFSMKSFCIGDYFDMPPNL